VQLLITSCFTLSVIQTIEYSLHLPQKDGQSKAAAAAMHHTANADDCRCTKWTTTIMSSDAATQVGGIGATFNALQSRGNYSAASNNMKLVHWPLMGELYPWYSDEGTRQPTQASPRCTKCNSPPINICSQCTNHHIAL